MANRCGLAVRAACPSVPCHQLVVQVPAERRERSVEAGAIKAPAKSIKSYKGAEGVDAIASSAHPVSGFIPLVLKSRPAFAHHLSVLSAEERTKATGVVRLPNPPSELSTMSEYESANPTFPLFRSKSNPRPLKISPEDSPGNTPRKIPF